MNRTSPGGPRPRLRSGTIIGLLFAVSGVACLLVRSYAVGGGWLALGSAAVVADQFWRGSPRWERMSRRGRVRATAVLAGLLLLTIAAIVIASVGGRR